MSITSDIRGYADTAIEQGKSVVEQAQAQFNDVNRQANDLVGKLTGTAKDNVSGLTAKVTDTATSTVNELRAQAEKAINFDMIKDAVEPYLAQAKHYGSQVTDRAEGILDTVRKDKRVAKVVATAESFTGAVFETVQARLVKPLAALAGRGPKPVSDRVGKPVARRVTQPAATTATKPTATRPIATKAPAKRATKATPAKTAARKATPAKTTARKAPAKKATPSS